jgi:hypothetical protein
MSKSADLADGESGGEVANPLLAPLTELQMAVLEAIWSPVELLGMGGQLAGWPTWDYVSRKLYRDHPTLAAAVEVLESLPEVPARTVNTRSYGLVWHDGHIAMKPGAENRVGLTIAGLWRLGKAGGGIRIVADELAGLIGYFAQVEAQMPIEPYEVAKTDIPLAENISGLTARTAAKPHYLTEPMVASVLQREYAPIQLFQPQNDGPYQVQLGRISLRDFRAIASAEQYLSLIERDVEDRIAPEPWTSPLTLVQTLDYLSYVLQADPLWDERQRLTQAPDLQSAAALTATVTTRAEYESALSGLWNVINQLHAPNVPDEIANSRFDGKQPGSIARLEYWLQRRLRTDQAAVARVAEALTLVRAVGRVRAEPQHASAEVRAGAVRARGTLGLPEVVYDYGNAWAVIGERLAAAFDVIRQEVQSAPVPQGGDADAS